MLGLRLRLVNYIYLNRLVVICQGSLYKFGEVVYDGDMIKYPQENLEAQIPEMRIWQPVLNDLRAEAKERGWRVTTLIRHAIVYYLLKERGISYAPETLVSPEQED